MRRLAPRAPKLNVECSSGNMLSHRDGRLFRSAQHLPLPFTNIAIGGAGGPRTGHVLPLDGRLFRRHRLPEHIATWMPKAEVRTHESLNSLRKALSCGALRYLESILCPLCKALGCDEETFFTQARAPIMVSGQDNFEAGAEAPCTEI